MKSILQGTGDYIKDCWHDFWFWVWDNFENWTFGMLKRTYCWRQFEGCYIKEGNLAHYIRQRRIGNKRMQNER